MGWDDVGLGAGIAIVVAGWRYIQEAFSTVQRLIVVTTRIDEDLAGILSRYLEATSKRSRTPRVSFAAGRIHVRPLQRTQWVVWEMPGDPGIWFYRGRFIRMDSTHVAGTYTKFFTLTYFRGTLDIRKLLADACMHVGTLGENRHSVHVLTGQAARNGNAGPPQKLLLNYVDRACGWEPDEVGAPTSFVSLATMSLSPEQTVVYNEMRVWLANQRWYAERGVPWRYSALLYGPPGTGKTTFVRASAQALDLPIIVFDIASMSNEELTEHWQACASWAPCVILIEDIDRVFDQNNELHSRASDKVLTFDRLLNCMAGVAETPGLMIFITANDITHVDPALLRAGRLDTHVYVGPLDVAGKAKVAARILASYDDEAASTVAASPVTETAAEFERRCQEQAVRLFSDEHRVTSQETV